MSGITLSGGFSLTSKKVPTDTLGIVAGAVGKAGFVSDVFGAISKVCKLAQQAPLSQNVAEFCRRNQEVATKGRDLMAVPYFFTTAQTFRNSYEAVSSGVGSWYTVARNACDSLAVGSFAISSLFPSLGVEKVGLTVKPAVDLSDAVTGAQTVGRYTELLSGDTALTDDVRSGLDYQRTTLLCKVMKYALAAIAGIGTFLSVVCGVTLSPAVAVALMVCAVGSAVLALVSGIREESAPYKVEILPV